MASADSFAYDLSVVVPVYNAEDYLDRCVRSLDAQTASQESFEVVLVNDGSPDGSLAICQRLVAERDNYVLVDQENQGVSAARNAGMRAAHGRYLMFLDPDDELSAPSIEAIVKTFDGCGTAIDLLTYPLCYHELETGKEHRNQRERWFAGSGTYNLSEVPQVAQSTINVVLRNAGDQTPQFDTAREIYEDQVFNTTILERRCAIGWCAEAEYRYYRSAGNTSSRRDRPELTFGDVISALELFKEMAERNPSFARYAYALILYNVGWRFRAGKLFPVFGDEETCRANCNRLAAVLDAIPLECWRESPYLSELWPIDQALRQGEEIKVAGHCLASPTMFAGRGLLLEMNGLERSVSIAPAFPQSTDTNVGVWCWKFAFTLPLGGKPYDAVLKAGNESYQGLQPELLFKVSRSNGGRRNRRLLEFGNRRLSLDGAKLHVGTFKDLPVWVASLAKPLAWAKDRRRSVDYDVEYVNDLRKRLPRELRKRKQEVLWLYDDGIHAPEVAHRPALARMQGDLDHADGVVRRYVVNSLEDDVSAALAGTCVERGSFEHLVCLLGAAVVIASCPDANELLPCEAAVFDRVRDFTREDQRYELLADAAQVVFAPAFDDIVTA